MKKIILLFFVMTTVFFSCGQESISTRGSVAKDKETSKPAAVTESQKRIAIANNLYIDTKYVYADAQGKQLIIENSLPKGGLPYPDPNGKGYVYVVFWTRITNETDHPFEWTMDFPEASYALPSSPGRYFKVLLPADTMTPDKEPLFDYGLDLKLALDNKLPKLSSLQKTIAPKGSDTFYVVLLFNVGVEGTIRTGLRINEQKLYYRINDKVLHCGKINLKDLKLQQ